MKAAATLTHSYASCAREVWTQSGPLVVAQIALMSTTVVDTMVAGYSSTADLAAVGVGSGIYVSVLLTAGGVVQAVSPMAAHHVGGGAMADARQVLRQGIWLALTVALLGMFLLWFSSPLMDAFGVPPGVAKRASSYLFILGLGLPGTMVYRACGAYLTAIGAPRALMHMGLMNAGLHVLLAPTLALGLLGTTPLGAVGSAVSVASINTLLAWLALRAVASRDATALTWPPDKPVLRTQLELVRLGWPIGFSALVEVTSFAAVVLLVAPLGEVAMGANRVLVSIGGMIYAIPFAFSMATMAAVGRAAGGSDWLRVQRIFTVCLASCVLVTECVGGVLMAFSGPVISAYTPNPEVQDVAGKLLFVLLMNQTLSAALAVAAYSLRGLKMSKVPMITQAICIWGIRVGGGSLLCFHGVPQAGLSPQGLAGYWHAGVVATALAALVLTLLFVRAAASRRQSPANGLAVAEPLPHSRSRAPLANQ